ncbi:MAG TPA: cytochrome c [Gemmatimonadales bacterium]|nr:cytochrome c [Gemmatimonadales bacterium]
MRTAFLTAISLLVAAPAPPAVAQAPDGAALYQQHCRACHGPTGAPPERLRTIYRTLPTLDSAFLTARSDDSLTAVIQNGAGKVMKGFKDKLSKEETLAIVRYLRTFRGSAATPD